MCSARSQDTTETYKKPLFSIYYTINKHTDTEKNTFAVSKKIKY